MPIIIAIIAIIAVGVGAYFFASRPVDQAEVMVATEETIARTDAELVISETPDDTMPDPGSMIVTPEEREPQVVEAATAASEAPAVIEHSVDVSYLTPSRTSHDMTVSLTITDGVVTDAGIMYDKGDGFSNPHQERFDGAYRSLVLGKPLNEISLSRVGGASLTSEAFNEAVQQISARL